MCGRIVALEKQPWVRPVGVGEIWRHLMAKCVLRVKGQEAKAACRTEQLSGGVEAGIYGGIHDTSLLWAQHSQE